MDGLSLLRVAHVRGIEYERGISLFLLLEYLLATLAQPACGLLTLCCATFVLFPEVDTQVLRFGKLHGPGKRALMLSSCPLELQTALTFYSRSRRCLKTSAP